MVSIVDCVNRLKDILDLNKRAWDKIAKKYDDRTQQEISDIFIEFTRTLPEKGKVLDLGCGTGIPYTKYLADTGFNVTGVDLSDEMVKVASVNIPQGTFTQCSMSEIEYRDEFNWVISSFSMLLLSPDLFKETASRIYKALKA